MFGENLKNDFANRELLIFEFIRLQTEAGCFQENLPKNRTIPAEKGILMK
jgi:hypothetical protein